MSKRSVGEDMLRLFNDSLERCRQSGDLAGQFYERLVADPTIRAFFVNTDLERQKRMLIASFYMVMGAAAGTEEGERHLEQLAEIHAGLGIPRETYAFWLECLLEAVEALDPKFGAEVTQAWRDVLRPGIETMKRKAPTGDSSKMA